MLEILPSVSFGQYANLPCETRFVHKENPWPSYQRQRICVRDLLMKRKYALPRGSCSNKQRQYRNIPSIPHPKETGVCTTKIAVFAGKVIIDKEPRKSSARVEDRRYEFLFPVFQKKEVEKKFLLELKCE